MVSPADTARSGFKKGHYRPVVNVVAPPTLTPRRILWFGPMRTFVLSCSGCGRSVECTRDRLLEAVTRMRRHSRRRHAAGRTVDYLDSTRLLRSHERRQLLLERG